MASVLENLTKKIELLGEGKIYEKNLFEPENLIAVIDIEDPRVYKQIFNLDNKGGLAIEKSLRSFIIEVKESLCTFYYMLDSACLSLDFDCKYQLREAIREVPLPLITYLRILCSKKAPIEISIDENFIYLVFEDSVVKDTTPKTKLKKGEKREKEVAKKYVLKLPLSTANNLDLAVIGLFKEVLDSDKNWDERNLSLPIDLSNITYEKEPLNIFSYEVETNKGNLRLINANGLSLSVVVCPLEVGKRYFNEKREDITNDLGKLIDLKDKLDVFCEEEEEDVELEELDELNLRISNLIGDSDE